MGVAIIARTDLFKARDFRPTAKIPRYPARAFAGYFASLGDMNDYLRRREGHIWRGGRPL